MRAIDWIILPLVLAFVASLALIVVVGVAFFGRARICPLCGNAVDVRRRLSKSDLREVTCSFRPLECFTSSRN